MLRFPSLLPKLESACACFLAASTSRLHKITNFLFTIHPKVSALPFVKDDIHVHFLHGSRDWISDEVGRSFASTDPSHYKVHTVPGCGHQMFVENPAGFADAVCLCI